MSVLTSIKEYPPGTTFFVPGYYDDLGNFVPTAPPQPITIDPTTNEPIPPTPPVYAPPPVPTVSQPGSLLNAFIREGVRCSDVDQVYSTGKLKPGVVTGWTASANAQSDDGLYAVTGIPAEGFTDTLNARQFPIVLPEAAQVTGIAVYVKRSAI